MKKSLTLIAGASLLMLGVPTISMAQAAPASGPFADVPADHWAYNSVDTLQKAGIVIGYPDGTYGGKRAMTRYEFAVAIARLLPLLHVDTSNLATKGDLAALQSDLESKLAANQAALDALTRLVNEFQPELQRLGQDVAQIKMELAGLEQRVAVVEAEQRRLKITGNLDLIARADNVRREGRSFVDENGTGGRQFLSGLPTTGIGGNTTTTSRHLFQRSDVYHNFDLNLVGKLSETTTANVKANFSNFLSSVGNTSAIGYGVNNAAFTGRNIQPGQLTARDSQNVFLQEAYLDAPLGLGPLGGARLQVGRVPVQFSKYTLQQVDADVYTNTYETDSGNIPFDGAKLGFKLGPAQLATFAGKNDTIPFAQPYGGSQGLPVGLATITTQTLNGNPFVNGGLNPAVTTPVGVAQRRPTGEIIANHAAPFTQGAGVRASIGSANSLQLSGTLEEFGLGTATNNVGATGPNDPIDPRTGRAYNKLTVYGADLNGALPFGLGGFLKKGAIGVDAAYTVSVQGGLKTNAGGTGYLYQSNEEQLSAQFGGLSLKGGYQYVGPYFSAPGYWGKLGAWTNPTNVRGPIVSAQYALTPKLALKADGQFYKAAYGGTNSPLQQNDRVTRYQVGLGYGLSSQYAVDLGYEDVLYDLRNTAGNTGINAGKPNESYLTLGVGHSFNNNASLKLLYQIVQYNDKGTNFDPINHDGGVAVGQFSLKF